MFVNKFNSVKLFTGWIGNTHYFDDDITATTLYGIACWKNNKRHGTYRSVVPLDIFCTMVNEAYLTGENTLYCTWINGVIHGEIYILCDCHKAIDVYGWFDHGKPVGQWCYISQLANIIK